MCGDTAVVGFRFCAMTRQPVGLSLFRRLERGYVFWNLVERSRRYLTCHGYTCESKYLERRSVVVVAGFQQRFKTCLEHPGVTDTSSPVKVQYTVYVATILRVRASMW